VTQFVQLLDMGTRTCILAPRAAPSVNYYRCFFTAKDGNIVAQSSWIASGAVLDSLTQAARFSSVLNWIRRVIQSRTELSINGFRKQEARSDDSSFCHS